MQNPLLNTKAIITTIDVYTDEEVTVNQFNIGKYFKHVYCLCPFTQIDFNILNKNTLEQSEIDQITSQMILYKTNINILKNMIHYGNLLYIQKDSIIKANHFNYNLEEMVLIIPFFNISFLNLQKYIDSLNGINTFDKLYDMIILNNYFGEDIKKQQFQLNLDHIIKTLSCSDFWKLEYNCKCNLTQLFNQRNFNFTILKASSNKIITDAISKLNIPIKGNYLEEIFKTRKYMDPSSVLCKKGYRLYSVVKSCQYTIQDIFNLFNILDDKLQFILYCQLIMSKEYCHLAINNILIQNDMISKNINIFEYLYGYAWLRFYYEESICKYNMKTTEMFIFDINTASKLPVFHFDYNNPQSNPYMPILVGNKSLNPATNIGGVVNNTTNHRICNLEEFIERFNIFCCNNKDKNLFQNIKFEDYKMAISGSIMTACLQYYHPLLEIYNVPNMSMNDLYNRFFNEYYCDSDIDIMIRTYDNFEFLDIGRNLYNMIKKNILSLYDYAEESHTNLVINKSVYLFVTNEFIRENIVLSDLSGNLTEDIVISLLNSPIIIKLFVPYAIRLHKIEMNKVLESLTDSDKTQLVIKYPEYFDFNPANLVVKLYNKKLNSTMVQTKNASEYTEEELEKILDFSSDEPTSHISDIGNGSNGNDINGISLTFSFKLRIISAQLDHDLEIFPIKKDDFMSTVSQFHMPCVRAYYNGNVYLTPSCISAHMTFMNIDYKYFAGSKDPIEIINKYRMRGFGTWLNENEIKQFIKYSEIVPFWQNLYSIQLHNKKSIASCLGPLELNHRLFYPRQFNFHLYTNQKIRPIPFDEPYVHVTVNNKITKSEYYSSRYSSVKNVMNQKIICPDTGYVLPIPSNILDIISTL
jgi:hypothetical protein